MTEIDRGRLERIEQFRKAMIEKLTTERNLSKTDWRALKKKDLFDLLLDEIVELKAAVRTFEDADRIGLGEFASFATPVANEALDVANFAFMVWDVFSAVAVEREENGGGRYQGDAQVDQGVGGRGEELSRGGEEHQEEGRGALSHASRGLDDGRPSTQDRGGSDLGALDLGEKTGHHESGIFSYSVTPRPSLTGAPAWLGKWSASCRGCGDKFSSMVMIQPSAGARDLGEALTLLEAEVVAALKARGWTFDPPRCHYCVDVHSVIGE